MADIIVIGGGHAGEMCIRDRIISAEKHPKADRLLVEQIDLGDETRQIVSGIAKSFKPEEVVGKKVVVVTNLKPVKLRGVESQDVYKRQVH